MLNREAICAHIPHAGDMCLLDRVTAWDENYLLCHSSSHRDPHNPLRHHGRLDAVCAIEYAAQAMALHGALCHTATRVAKVAFLAALRDVRLYCANLDSIESELAIRVERLGGDENGFIYTLRVHGVGRLLVEGRATVMNAKEPTP